MKRILTYSILLLAGIGIGICIAHFFIDDSTIQPLKKEETTLSVSKKIKKHIVRDTIEVKKYVNIPINKDFDSSKQQSINQSDTTITDSSQVANNPQDSDTIKDVLKEQLIAQQTVTLPKKAVDSSDVEALLDVKSKVFSDNIVVEFWDSPLNLIGYQLTRNKLKLYGFNPNETVTLVRGKKSDELLLKTPSIQVDLFKSNQFKSITIK